MSATLMDRITTLLAADAHGVVDALEERSLLVRQHLREAEQDLARKRARLAASSEEERRLGAAIERCEARIAKLDADVALALGEGREALARFAIRQLLPLRDQATELEAKRAQCAQTRERLAETLDAQESALEALRRRARAALAEDVALSCASSACDEAVEIELLRRIQAREDA